MNHLNPKVALWAASVIVEDMSSADVAVHHKNSREIAIGHYKAKLELCGVKPLKKSQLQTLWAKLKTEPWIISENKTIRKSDKIQIWKDFIAGCLELDGAKQLKYVANNAAAAATATATAATAASSPGAIPPVASLPSRSTASHPRSPHAAAAAFQQRMQQHNNNFNRQMQQQHQLLQQQIQQQRRLEQRQHMMAMSGFHSSPFRGRAGAPAVAPNNRNMAAAAAAGGYGAGGYGGQRMHPNRALDLGAPQSSGSRKRKSPGAPNNGMDIMAPSMDMGMEFAMDMTFDGANPFLEAMTAAASAARGAANNNNSNNNGGLSAVESRILSQLESMGFDVNNSDDIKKECLDAIRRAVEKAGDSGDVPTADSVMMDIVTAREEADEAKKMDEARKRSEKTVQEEAVRLREQRRKDDEDKILKATFDELRNPIGVHNCKLFFQNSWLLGHDECLNLLTSVVNEPGYIEAKKILIEILKLEKKCRKWYDGKDELPKYYFTFEVGKRLLALNTSGDPQTLCDGMKSLLEEMNKGILLSTDLQPEILLRAKEEYQGDSQEDDKNDDDDDNDDDIVVLTEEEVQKMQEKKAESNPSLGTARPAVVCE